MTIHGFVAGDNGDAIDIIFNSDVDNTSSTGSFANNYVLGDPDPVVAGLNTGAIIEVSTSTYQLSTGWDLEDVASVLSSGGTGNNLVQLDDGEYCVVIYDCTTDTANAHIFHIRVDDEDGFDLAYAQGTTEATGTGDDEFSDLDAIEYLGMLTNVGADALTIQNFI